MGPSSIHTSFLLGVFLVLDILKVSDTQTLKPKVICEGSKARLRCKKSQIILLYSAEYGWGSDEVPLCGIKKPHLNKCDTDEDVSDAISKICAGKQKCIFRVSSKKFNYPCSKKMKHRLKLFYSCAPKKVLPITSSSTPTLMVTTITTTKYTASTVNDNQHVSNTTVFRTTMTTPKSDNATQANKTTEVLVQDDPAAVHSNDFSTLFGIISSLIACYFFVIGTGKQGALLSFVCSAAGGILIMLFVVLATSIMKHRSGQFSVDSESSDEYVKKEEPEVRNGTLRPHISPQESTDESHQEDTIENKQKLQLPNRDRPDEEFGYIADDIMRYYSSRNIGNDSQRSIRKISMSFDEPELISMANETPDMMEKKYNSFNRFSDSKEVDYDELMEQLHAISYEFTLSNREYDELDNIYLS